MRAKTFRSVSHPRRSLSNLLRSLSNPLRSLSLSKGTRMNPANPVCPLRPLSLSKGTRRTLRIRYASSAP
ncbi:hypothetical protein PLANTIT3_60054 [Plantibacter sp. T3]|nr:hypothetical protein PLANTIT3_60054 [Plantibacter sp. T3]